MGKIQLTKSGKICKVIVQYCLLQNLYWVFDMEPNTLIYALNEFIVIILHLLNYAHYRSIFSIIKFQGLVARQPYLCKNIPYLVCHLDNMVARYIC